MIKKTLNMAAFLIALTMNANSATSFDYRVSASANYLSFEKIAPSTLYLGFEGFYNLIGSRIAELEARIGYNLKYNNNDYLCPYVGGGVFKSFSNSCLEKHKEFKKSAFGYGSLGLFYDHQILSIFHLGFRSELMLGSQNNELIYGFQGRIPVCFLFGGKQAFDLRFEPFAIFFSKKETSFDFYGLLILLGYKF